MSCYYLPKPMRDAIRELAEAYSVFMMPGLPRPETATRLREAQNRFGIELVATDRLRALENMKIAA